MVLRGLFLLAITVFALPAAACGPDSDCMIGERHYRIALPQGYDASVPVPAIVFAHGYRGSARGVMRNRSLRGLASDLGAALIAVKSGDQDWVIPNAPRHLDTDGAAEFAYFDAVLSDAATRFALDRDRIIATGFSAGGMMVWNLACARPEMFAGFVPIAGTYWLKPPETCAAPAASIVHIHGDQDKTVPLLGRPIGPTKQGKVPAALNMYEAFGEFGNAEAAQYDGLSCKEQRNDDGELLAFCLFKGGHSFRTEHLRHGWEQLQKAGQL
ncbi:PHB depolymerase family esterase [Roseobacter sp. OBYS 0001]|uniref:alpha/beta hydrolase family esterase n=1 Tax=Roseobacter sp. OBYS 0001 TaxID=882651 RepID=UPI001BC375DA|nr:prolyl oligopeptidase family serine peptidase [Roseobacter sp. OBYS 0001]GIT89335.1 hypothetical protein ROBYS_43510 [Roseobacter sp. OBYS 0001]